MSRTARPRAEAAFLGVGELVERLGIASVTTLDRWIAAGQFPPPWAYMGPRRRVWRADHLKTYHDSGEWPREAWKRA